mmetsp:Transcript_81858/g.213080  ORF Transcript_81858/g.213080 Transcript_81858/m.213080 type:complete len:770 (-) Transcript_81858:212-2521(-)
MPALTLFNRKFLLAPDDFWTFMWVFIVLHPIWIALDLDASIWTGRLEEASVPHWAAMTDISLCLLTIPIDCIITVCSAWGAIMRPRKCEGCLKCCLYLRLFSALPLFVVCFYMFVPVSIRIYYDHQTENHEEVDWMRILMGVMLVCRMCFYSGIIVALFLVLLPRGAQDKIVEFAAKAALYIVGAGDGLFQSVARVMYNVSHKRLGLEEIAPTDILYGMLLVMAEQNQGPMGMDPDCMEVVGPEESEGLIQERTLEDDASMISTKLPKSVSDAAKMHGQTRPLTKFSTSQELDHAAMQEITYLMPYASAIYGPFLFGLPAKAFEEGSNCPRKPCAACCGAMPCWQRLRPNMTMLETFRRRCCCLVPCCCCCCYNGVAKGDWCCGTNEDYMNKSVWDACPNRMEKPELVWASWRNNGPGKALPMSVFRNDARKEFIVTVRGTADIESIVDDMGVEPVYWDPLGLCDSGVANKSPPFDEEQDCFVPFWWLNIAKDMFESLRSNGTLQQIQDKPGYRILVTGHSLGAGTGSLLALHFEQWVRTLQTQERRRVHFCGFEPPGCSMSKTLSRWTQEAGWMSVVCAYDWVPRVSPRNIERLRELAIKKLNACDRSKMQLSILLVAGLIDRTPLPKCLRKCLAAPFYFFAGGRLNGSNCMAYSEDQDFEPLEHCEPSYPFMVPAGDVVYLRPCHTQWLCCGLIQKDTAWSAVWADPQDVQSEHLILDRRAFDLHVPWVYEHAINYVADHFFGDVGWSLKGAAFQPRLGGRRKDGRV